MHIGFGFYKAVVDNNNNVTYRNACENIFSQQQTLDDVDHTKRKKNK